MRRTREKTCVSIFIVAIFTHIYMFTNKFLNNDGIMFDRGVYFVPEFTVDGYTRCDLAHSEKTDDGDKFYIGGKLVEYDEYVRYIGAKDNWKIAKKFGSTVEEIARVNGIELVDKLNVEQQLFIPRYNG